MRPSKRNELVEKSLTIFYKNGFHATGMDMLASQTGISKTSMYKYFETKEDLILATLKLRDEKFLDWFFNRLEQLTTSPQEQLLAMFDVVGEWCSQPDFANCMFIKASSEYQNPDHPIHKQAADHKRQKLAKITEIAKQAKLKNAEKIARQLLLLIEGATVSAHIGHTKDPAVDAKIAARKVIG